MTNVEACIELGVIQRGQGLKGHMVALLNQDVTSIGSLKTVFIQIDHTLVPYHIEKWVSQPSRAVIKLQGVDDLEAAYQLKGCPLFVEREVFAEVSTQEAPLVHLIGYRVVEAQAGELGCVQDLYAVPLQQLLAVDYQGRELLIPYHKNIVIRVDDGAQRIDVQLPKGFLAVE